MSIVSWVVVAFVAIIMIAGILFLVYKLFAKVILRLII